VSNPETTDRSPKDYAIEFGNYLASAAEHYMQAVNAYEAGGKANDIDGLTDAWRALESAIHEFRKRAIRAEYGVHS
jgi:hypothetical protein